MKNNDREQTTIRLTLRPPGELDEMIRIQAERKGISMNQFILGILARWAKSRRSQLHSS